MKMQVYKYISGEWRVGAELRVSVIREQSK